LGIFTFLNYANEESDDVIGGSTETAQHSIENISRNIQKMFFKLIGTSNVHHKINRDTFYVVAMATLLALVSFREKNKYRHLQLFKEGQRVLLGTHMVPILS